MSSARVVARDLQWRLRYRLQTRFLFGVFSFMGRENTIVTH
mgnify:CR=1 FL=1